MKLGVVTLIALLLAGCSNATPAAPASATESAAMVAKNCANPQWKDKNLGLWYSVCRQPMDW
jgi:PBP1b-binding outer membrane lipoprotein LpoB